MPAMIVWPVSSSRTPGRSGPLGELLDRVTPSFSWSPLVLGSMATWMTGSGKVIDSRTTGLLMSARVSPVVVPFRPMAA